MSSLRNAVKRRTHKERAQPAKRQKLGLLEKKKDYRLRARDYHKKELRLRALRVKAAEKNPDEFYFKMVGRQTEQGLHRVHDGDQWTEEELELMRTQDVGYLRMRAAVDRTRAERLQAALPFEEAGGTHTVFVEDAAELAAFDAAEHFDTAPELAGRAHNRPRRTQLEEGPLVAGAPSGRQLKKARRRLERARARAQQELEQRRARASRLESAAEAMELQKHLAGKGPRQKVTVEQEDGSERQVYRWKNVRKK